MAKDPAFLFYSDNFQSGTQFFSDEQTGKYIRLLCAQHLHGHLSEKHMMHICKSHDVEIFAKFSKDADGKYYNERLEFEILRRRNYSESRASNRKSTNKKQKKPKNISKSYEKHMGNGNGNGNGIENEAENKRIKEFLNNQKWKEEFCMAKKISMSDLEKMQQDFVSDVKLKGEHIDSYKKYFLNSYNKKVNGTDKQFDRQGSKLGTSDAKIAALKKW